jgi:hypothetical protein
MRVLSIYNELSLLKSKLFKNSFILNENYKYCWQSVSSLTDALCNDLKYLTDQDCFVTKVNFILDDPFYRQSASGCLMEVKFGQDEEFVLMVECLIDFEKILLKVKNQPGTVFFKSISNMIETKYNSEFSTELRDLTK